MRTLFRRIWHAIRHRRFEAELAEEIDFHRAMRARDLEKRGLHATEATRAATRALGNVGVARDQVRDVWIPPWLQGLSQDLRFAVRLLVKDRTFTAAAVLTLALGIGLNASIFSAVYGILLKPLPFTDPDRLVAIWKKNPPRGWTRNPVSAAELVRWPSHGQVLADIAAFRPMSCVVTGGSGPEADPCETVSSNLFPMLGVTPIRGRAFVTEEDDPDAPRVAILGYGLWQRRFGGSLSAIGGTIMVNGLIHTIVGVMPFGVSHAYATPYAPIPEVWVSGIALAADRTWNDYMAIGRLRPKVGLRQTEAAMNSAAAGLEQAYPDLEGWRAELMTLREMNSGDVRLALLVLSGAVVFVFLIVCANVSNLLLTRATGRAHEFAMRAALGAGEWRVVRQLLTESLLISVIGGVLGLMLAWIGTQAFVSLAPGYAMSPAPGLPGTPLDLRVVLVTLAASLATTLLFGLVPALQGARSDLAEALKETGRGSQHPRKARARHALVIAQIALAMVLLVGAGLMIRTLSGLRAVGIGVDPANVLTLRIPLAGDRYKDPRVTAAFWTDVVESVRGLPGVESAAVSRGVPIGDWSGEFFTTADRPNPEAGHVPDANYIVVGPDYFTTLRIPVRKGRTFDAHDTENADRVVVINEELARLYWPGENPLGKRLRMGTSMSASPWLSVVGVVGNVFSQGIVAGYHAEIYVPYRQYPWVLTPRNLIVRTARPVPPGSVIGAVLREIHRVDKDEPAADIRALEQTAGEPLAQQRMVAALLGAFAGLALMLAALGIYGVLSYSVAQRTREIGVRVALGADPASVLRLVIGDGGRLAAVGIGIGITASIALTRLLTDLLYGVRPTDSWTFVVGALTLASAALLACYGHARRAIRVDPIDVLRRD